VGDQWPAGWYDDPSGTPRQQRWWNGESWSAQVRSADGGDSTGATGATGGPASEPIWPAPERPTEVLQHGPGWADWDDEWSVYAPPSLPGPAEPPAPSMPRRWILGMGGTAIGLVLIALVAVLLTRGGDEPKPAAAPSAGDPSPRESGPGAPTNPPGRGGPADPSRVSDPASGLSYARLPDWLPWSGAQVTIAGVGTAGQYVVTQQEVPSGGEYIAQVVLGLVDSSVIQYDGPDSLQAAAQALSRLAERDPDMYPPHTVAPLPSERITVDGHPGWRVRVDLKFTDAKGYTATGERLDVAVIDLGGKRLGGVLASIPNDRNDLLPDVDEAYRTLRIDAGGVVGPAGPAGPPTEPTA
jgi:hypothetical protein